MKEKQRLCTAIRETSPCKDCTEKFTACHDRCPKDERGEFGYQAWKTMNEEMKQKKKEYYNLNRSKSWRRTNF